MNHSDIEEFQDIIKQKTIAYVTQSAVFHSKTEEEKQKICDGLAAVNIQLNEEQLISLKRDLELGVPVTNKPVELIIDDIFRNTPVAIETAFIESMTCMPQEKVLGNTISTTDHLESVALSAVKEYINNAANNPRAYEYNEKIIEQLKTTEQYAKLPSYKQPIVCDIFRNMLPLFYKNEEELSKIIITHIQQIIPALSSITLEQAPYIKINAQPKEEINITTKSNNIYGISELEIKHKLKQLEEQYLQPLVKSDELTTFSSTQIQIPQKNINYNPIYTPAPPNLIKNISQDTIVNATLFLHPNDDSGTLAKHTLRKVE